MKKIINIIILFLLFGGFLGVYYITKDKKVNNEGENIVDDFTTKIIRESFKAENYLISPYSMEVALNMLSQGAQGDTKKELNEVVKPRALNISNDNVKIANALFIKNVYGNIIENNFKNILKEKYNSEILYDEFYTPDVINNWVNDKTDGMIEKVINEIDPSFVLGLANAIAIDAKWSSPFECSDTKSEKFTRLPGKSINVEMMHKIYSGDAKYLINNDMKAVLLPYQENLEFVAILPDRTIEKYIDKLNINALNNEIDKFTEATSEKRLYLSIPRFNYSYDLGNFKEVLISMGIKSVFDADKSNLTSIITRENMDKYKMDNIYVSDAIHKTYIDLNEEGTRAAAVTYFGIKTSGAFIDDYELVEIEFNKPFIYMIRDKSSKEVLFFGTVYEPNVWNGSTCEE